MQIHLSRCLATLPPDQAEEIEDFLFLEDCESRARSQGDLDWADLLLSQLQQTERHFTSDQKDALRAYYNGY